MNPLAALFFFTSIALAIYGFIERDRRKTIESYREADLQDIKFWKLAYRELNKKYDKLCDTIKAVDLSQINKVNKANKKTTHKK